MPDPTTTTRPADQSIAPARAESCRERGVEISKCSDINRLAEEQIRVPLECYRSLSDLCIGEGRTFRALVGRCSNDEPVECTFGMRSDREGIDHTTPDAEFKLGSPYAGGSETELQRSVGTSSSVKKEAAILQPIDAWLDKYQPLLSENAKRAYREQMYGIDASVVEGARKHGTDPFPKLDSETSDNRYRAIAIEASRRLLYFIDNIEMHQLGIASDQVFSRTHRPEQFNAIGERHSALPAANISLWPQPIHFPW